MHSCTELVWGYRCIDALVTMGVLVPGGDRTAVRRTAEFFLKNFEVSCQPLYTNLQHQLVFNRPCICK